MDQTFSHIYMYPASIHMERVILPTKGTIAIIGRNANRNEGAFFPSVLIVS